MRSTAKWGAVLTAFALAASPAVGLAQSSRTGGDAPRPAKSQDAKTAVSDTWITAKSKIALFADDRASGMDVRVETNNGIVTLKGKVDSPEAKAASEQVVRGIEGVRDVRNELQVVSAAERKQVDAKDDDIKKRVKENISRSPELKGSDVEVEVTNGVVRLTGEVEHLGMSAAASEQARRVPGVKTVRNELKVKNEDRAGTWDSRRTRAERVGDRMQRTADRAGEKMERATDRARDRLTRDRADAPRPAATTEGDRGMRRDRDAATGRMASSSEQTRQVQEALKDKGHDPGPIDGIMGPRTRAAIREFQKQENLPQTGRADAATLARLGVEAREGRSAGQSGENTGTRVPPSGTAGTSPSSPAPASTTERPQTQTR